MSKRRSPYDVIRCKTYDIHTDSPEETMALFRLFGVKGFLPILHGNDPCLFSFVLPER